MRYFYNETKFDINDIRVFHQGAAEEAARPQGVAGPSGVKKRPREVVDVPSTDTEDEGEFVRPPPRSTTRQRSALESSRQPSKRSATGSSTDDALSQVNVIVICGGNPQTTK